MLKTALTKSIQIIGRNARDLALVLGIGPKLRADNRTVLEESVFPFINSAPSLRRVLFVGCHWYTWHYNSIFAGKEFWTIEINPERARYGSARHIVDSVENVQNHFDPSSLDVVMMIGVIGWGLDEPAAIERSLAACKEVLRRDGLLVLGCDEVPEHSPVDLNASPALQSLEPFVLPALGDSRRRCQGELCHTLTFYQKIG